MSRTLHPLAWIEERHDRGTALLVLVTSTALLVLVLPEGDSGVVFALIGAVALFATHDWGEAVGLDEVEREQRLYATGAITMEEFERRVELILDERANRIRAAVEEVGGIGPELSTNVALEFDSLEELEHTSAEDLADRVSGIGEAKAEAVVDYLGGRSRPRRVEVEA